MTTLASVVSTLFISISSESGCVTTGCAKMRMIPTLNTGQSWVTGNNYLAKLFYGCAEA